MFSAWVTNIKTNPTEKFSWKTAGFIISIPLIQSLFDRLTQSSRVQKLGIIATLNHACESLNRVDHKTFLEKFSSDKSIQHFYEPFLKEFDPVLQKELGVWYTPEEIVEYMVERIDIVLRQELGIHDGLANENVHVLDPCCGTGAYLLQVLRRIEKTKRSETNDALVGADVLEAAKNRIFGFEIMPAPFIVSHWRINEFIQSLGVNVETQVNSSDHRIGVYLTNALTGWKEKHIPSDLFFELREEVDKATEIKQKKPIWVILGNPPYNAYAKPGTTEENDLVESYKDGLITQWNIKKFNLGDLYVKFFSIAENCILRNGKGIVSYISNYSWTEEQSFVVMRKHMLDSFDKIWIENLHGNRKNSERAPDGTTSETIFAMPGISTGIQQGVVTSLLLKSGNIDGDSIVLYRDDVDAAKAGARREQLLKTLNDDQFDDKYVRADPRSYNRYSFKPVRSIQEYNQWPRIVDLATDEGQYSGLLECRGGSLIDHSREVLEDRMKVFLDSDVDWQELVEMNHGLTVDRARFPSKPTRSKLISKEKFQENRLVRYTVRPFDVQWAYYTGVRPIWNECRPEFWVQSKMNDKFIVSRKSQPGPLGYPVFFCTGIGDYGCVPNSSKFFPFRYGLSQSGLLSGKSVSNLSVGARDWLSKLDECNPDEKESESDKPWFHVLAICYSPKYITENSDMLSIDWPRVPIPKDREDLNHSVSFGKRVSALLDIENITVGVEDVLDNSVRGFGLIQHNDLRINVGWGRRSKNGILGGAGKLKFRSWDKNEKDALVELFDLFGIEQVNGFNIVGKAIDVYLNNQSYWKGVPEAVWNFQIGRHLVLKKWLSYREESLLGRAIHPSEARLVTSIVWRLMTLVMMSKQLDENYESCKESSYTWEELA